MSLKKISWTNYFTTDPPLPFDVAFNIIEGELVTEQILAHRYLLATCSSVFCTEFFGLLAEKRKIIPIKETTRHAFNFLLQYIYGFNLDYEISVDQLFEILNLAERYDIAALREHITTKLAELSVIEEEVVEVARVALAYSHFDSASNSVLLACSRLLKKYQESPTLHFPHDQPLVAHLLSLEEPVAGDEDELGCAIHDLFNDPPCPPRPKVATTPLQNLNSVNWMDLLEPTSRIPPDVSFKIMERPNNNEGEGEEKVMGEVRAHKYYLAAVSDTFKSLFFGHEEGSHSGHTDEALDYCDNNLCEGSVGIQKFKKRSEETIELKECGGELKAVSKQICDRGGEEEEQHVKQTGVEDITVVCSSVGAFQVMIDYLYGKFPTLRGAEEICEIFEIVDLAERFKVVGLEDEYRTAMFLYFRERPRWNSSPV